MEKEKKLCVQTCANVFNVVFLLNKTALVDFWLPYSKEVNLCKPQLGRKEPSFSKYPPKESSKVTSAWDMLTTCT